MKENDTFFKLEYGCMDDFCAEYFKTENEVNKYINELKDFVKKHSIFRPGILQGTIYKIVDNEYVSLEHIEYMCPHAI